MNELEAAKTKDPFYIIAHMANNRETLDWAVSQGADGIESDFQFNNDGYPSVIEHGWPCDCRVNIYKDSICRHGLHGSCSGSKARNDPTAHVRHVAQLKGVALFIIDSKIKAKLGNRLVKAGKKTISFLDKNLFKYGYKGKVIIGSSKVDTFEYIKGAVIAANNSANKDHYFFTFDGEGDDYKNIINEEHGMTYIWTLDKESSMKDYINRNVQGIITNRIALAKRVAVSMGVTMANVSTPIPTSKFSTPPVDKCDCDYHKGGCTISWPAPSKKACKCRYKDLMWTCEGSLVDCDVSLPKCLNPDASKEACQLGQGDCDGYQEELH
ncbi:unnamed protein product [Adineta steineri]|uniref:Uncharacterized protein n=2 Tax=Adineta steineri TaxID=433720 RepID=A0A819R0E6_9BILA|nr:unnamed protein product [Adineta steineri]